ncbi:peptidase T [Clostridium tyrobutyricum]|jgi:tripeptide aminopeptidase|uniref:Peptidase T n=1 Tax=Clostridium tyrobutyricum DIVETGP TaxID=1408889 RepID=W6N3U4_CLOTY|nr:peptidase T [Clostridium tyrobutyricum]AND84093.1 peptidase T [Clostridium tyrobutyricum]ANP68823.1 peptidase T [Clostridium tyrobutyricum]MBV4417436.1 peptidase T [Clostridium tyrobutyricum]MBV4422898.1 peptidase T [Clostridium tyrobutyricum]MBV4424888.1 peptidase T [Clostridium tyrobutyricum]
MESVTDKFLRYIVVDTRSSEESNTVPTTKKQLNLGKKLVQELKQIGIENANLDENGYVMAFLAGNTNKKVPAVGFISHMDTSPEISGENVKPNIVTNYDGSDIVLNSDKNIVLSTKDFPEIKNYIGETIITTDGNTLLGADDKAGVAEIMTAVEYLVNHPEIKHGDIKIGFTPDEEVGKGPDYFDVKKFNAEFAYTIDGGQIGELEFENFNAASAKVKIKGRNVHPGYAKNKMINSMLIAAELIGMLPKNEVPEATEGHEGFYHLISINGGVEETELYYIIRDFDSDNFEKRKKFMLDSMKLLNKKYGSGVVSIDVKDQYRNMKEKIEHVKYVVDIAYEAIKQSSVEPEIVPIRGGTDGARLSFMGLPTPNIFTGGHNFHGRYEYIPVFAMEKAVEVIINIVELISKM